jgi:hypothetical protein
VEVDVTVMGSCTHATGDDIEKLQPEIPNRRFLRGNDRISIARDLQRTVDTPASLYEKRLCGMKVDEFKSGNTTQCQTKHIFRQALYETQKRERIHDNVFIEIDMLREAWDASLPGCNGVPGFIHGVGIFPFYVIMYTEA